MWTASRDGIRLRSWRMVNLMHGDCIELMKQIPAKSVDMILCDLPYGTTACKWDSIIPFDKLWEQYKRIVKDNGAIALFGSEPFSTKLRASNLSMFKYDWIWVKSRGVGFLNAKNAPLKKHEIISVFSDGTTANCSKNRMNYYPQGLIEINKVTKSVSQGKDTVVGSRPSRQKDYISKYTGYPSSVIYYNNESKQVHPTQKPVPLLEYLIKTYTNEGEIVLDNCMGSGSTGVACVNTDRNFIGIELDDHYFEVATERINQAQLSKSSQ